MKYGAHSYIFTEYWTDEQLHLLDTAVELGLDCFEIGIGDDIVYTPELTRRRAEALGLTLIVSPGGLWPVECDFRRMTRPIERGAGLAQAPGGPRRPLATPRHPRRR